MGLEFNIQSDSQENTLDEGKHEIQEIAEGLNINPRENLVNAAHRFYTIAVEHNYLSDQPTSHVAGVCLYIVCRQQNMPYMLIDFSDFLKTNVYGLGTVFKRFCQLLRHGQHPILQRCVDPSLFIHRFAQRLHLGESTTPVANCALRLVAGIKREWMQSVRLPSGVCGVALFIATRLHGFERSNDDVARAVHICGATRSEEGVGRV